MCMAAKLSVCVICLQSNIEGVRVRDCLLLWGSYQVVLHASLVCCCSNSTWLERITVIALAFCVQCVLLVLLALFGQMTAPACHVAHEDAFMFMLCAWLCA